MFHKKNIGKIPAQFANVAKNYFINGIQLIVSLFICHSSFAKNIHSKAEIWDTQINLVKATKIFWGIHHPFFVRFSLYSFELIENKYCISNPFRALEIHTHTLHTESRKLNIKSFHFFWWHSHFIISNYIYQCFSHFSDSLNMILDNKHRTEITTTVKIILMTEIQNKITFTRSDFVVWLILYFFSSWFVVFAGCALLVYRFQYIHLLYAFVLRVNIKSAVGL